MSALRSGYPLLRGLLRFIVGAIFAFLALLLTATALTPDMGDTFSAFAIAVFLAGLSIDALLGESVRSAIGIPE
ncbi:MAG: hypothetical protein M3R51_04060 [Candidatus Eremiobacteraeota bacterium]|nr:hypothetical protein [Candidatus Eremiobacteraeota bacterium]